MPDVPDQWADARTPLTEEQMFGTPPQASADDPPVKPEELAREIYTLAHGSRAWDELTPSGRREKEWQAARIQDRLADRRLTDPQRRAISRVESAADRAADDVLAAVQGARGLLGGSEDAQAAGRREGILYALDQIGRRSGVDEIAGIGCVADALRTLRRETL